MLMLGGKPMPELRKNPADHSWVIIATERSKRPSDLIKKSQGAKEDKGGPRGANGGRPAPGTPEAGCPFCEGNENKTPPEVFAFRKPGTQPDTPGWTVRVVPNKFAALSPEGSPDRTKRGLWDTLNGVGAHEVIVEGTDHWASWPQKDSSQVTAILKAWQARYRAQGEKPFIRYTQLFKNHGLTAGASLAHPHSQLISTPFVPDQVQRELDISRKYWESEGRCLYCDLLAAEEQEGIRAISSTPYFLAFCPFASRFPSEVWILPRRHQPSFAAMDDVETEDLSALLIKILGVFYAQLGDPPYNLILRTSPHGEQGAYAAYHWHLRLLPRLSIVAGFEWGTGIFINPSSPEEAAKFLAEHLGPSRLNQGEQTS